MCTLKWIPSVPLRRIRLAHRRSGRLTAYLRRFTISWPRKAPNVLAGAMEAGRSVLNDLLPELFRKQLNPSAS